MNKGMKEDRNDWIRWKSRKNQKWFLYFFLRHYRSDDNQDEIQERIKATTGGFERLFIERQEVIQFFGDELDGEEDKS